LGTNHLEKEKRVRLFGRFKLAIKYKLFRTYVSGPLEHYDAMTNIRGVHDCFNAQTFLGAYQNGTINPDIGGACVAISSKSGSIPFRLIK
jgi:hypothetical protein